LRRDPDFFPDGIDLGLLYIAKKLKESLRLEQLLDEAGIDYLIEVDMYLGGLIFRSERAGAFFYVLPQDLKRASDLLLASGFKVPTEPKPD
jgi:hypothetical protein